MPLDRSFWPADPSDGVQETTVGSVLRAAADAAPDRIAVIAWGLTDGERRTWTYGALLADAERAARALLARFAPGERIALWAPNLPEWLILELGAGLAGLVVVTVNPAYQARELDYVLRQSRSVGLFHVDGFRGNPMARLVGEVRDGLPELREVIALEGFEDFLAGAPAAASFPSVTPDSAAQIQYTSGTTGFPKGALLHHRGLTNNARLCMERLGAGDGDVFAHAMPFFHTAGCVLSALGPIQVGATHAFLPAFDPVRALDLVERERATHFLGVPTMLIAMMEHPSVATRDLSSLVAVCSGGASVAPELVRAIEARLGVRFSIVYGQTEASPVITQTRLDDSPEDKAETVGVALPATEVKIVDPMTHQIVAPGEIGELCTRGYLVMHEYFDKPDATRTAIDADGWLHTGDLGTMDERGYCRITGRLKDMVIRGGENLFPAEIEAVLLEHPDVGEAAVIGVPDSRMGEELAAFVRVAGGNAPSVESLRAHVRARLAAPKTPRYWVFVDAFPLTGSGKIQKFVLRERWERGELQPAS
ncbi:MAG: AMP-binding protein [Deltaproteobacteria bacterium]|nr:AMP-binding protein [Deltaproteobacteria bacterium]